MNLAVILSGLNFSEMTSFGIFLLFVFGMLAIDLGVFNKHEHVISTREAAGWTLIWAMLALGMYAFILYFGEKIHGISADDPFRLEYIKEKYGTPFAFDRKNYELSVDHYRSSLGLEFITGYIVELSLSVDNIFVIILIFASFGVEKRLYHRVLFWGILGAIIFRFIFIFTGAFLINKFQWIIFVFAGFLVFTGIRMFLSRDKEDKIDTERHPIVRFCSKYFRVHPKYEGRKFWLKADGKTFVTPLFIVLLIVEFSDVLFAVDSVPAVFAITKDPYIVFFSNIFAILGLRTMFFLLLNVMDKFHYFKVGLAFILVFVGGKMFGEGWLHKIGFTTGHSLLVIVGILLISIAASLLFPKKEK